MTPLPCPFCGSTKIDLSNDGSFIDFLECSECQAKGPGVAFDDDTFDIACAEWNKRDHEAKIKLELQRERERNDLNALEQVEQIRDLTTLVEAQRLLIKKLKGNS